MGAQLSKTAGKAETAAEKPGEAVASPTKTNGQVNDILTSSSLHPSQGESGRAGGGERGGVGGCALWAQSVRNCGRIE